MSYTDAINELKNEKRNHESNIKTSQDRITKINKALVAMESLNSKEKVRGESEAKVETTEQKTNTFDSIMDKLS